MNSRIRKVLAAVGIAASLVLVPNVAQAHDVPGETSISASNLPSAAKAVEERDAAIQRAVADVPEAEEVTASLAHIGPGGAAYRHMHLQPYAPREYCMYLGQGAWGGRVCPVYWQPGRAGWV